MPFDKIDIERYHQGATQSHLQIDPDVIPGAERKRMIGTRTKSRLVSSTQVTNDSYLLITP
jgi:hypothetical protein